MTKGKPLKKTDEADRFRPWIEPQKERPVQMPVRQPEREKVPA